MYMKSYLHSNKLILRIHNNDYVQRIYERKFRDFTAHRYPETVSPARRPCSTFFGILKKSACFCVRHFFQSLPLPVPPFYDALTLAS